MLVTLICRFMASAPLDAVQQREREFHNALSDDRIAADQPPRDPDEYERFILAKLGNVMGCHVLDMGCGTGDLTLQLLSAGATVTALDLSERMVRIAESRVKRFGDPAAASFLVAPIEETGLETGSFDFVVGKWILHHANVARSAIEISRLLRKGGRAIFVENSGLNPALLLARKVLVGRFGIARWGTEDEHPLVAEDYRYFAAHFRWTKLVFPNFYFFQLADRQIFRFRHQRLSRYLRGADDMIWTRFVFLRRFSYHVILELGT